MCAEGGFGGTSWCNTSVGSPYCCGVAAGFCYTPGAALCCGVICNLSTSSVSAVGSAVTRAQAYGGDVNCQGMFGCVVISACCANIPCQYIATIPVPAGYISSNGANITYALEDNNGTSTLNGQGLAQFLTGLNAAGKQPHHGGFKSHCMGNVRKQCGCYENNGCGNWLPIGTGGLMVTPCDGVCDTGSRGGQGALRIRWYQ